MEVQPDRSLAQSSLRWSRSSLSPYWFGWSYGNCRLVLNPTEFPRISALFSCGEFESIKFVLHSATITTLEAAEKVEKDDLDTAVAGSRMTDSYRQPILPADQGLPSQVVIEAFQAGSLFRVFLARRNHGRSRRRR
jgi:hypothetical protein